MAQRVLTGITTTGAPHLGNYVGAVLPALAAGRDPAVESFYFLADCHALAKCQDAERVRRARLEVAASWLAAGLDPERSVFYCQSAVPEIMTLYWLLCCVTAKGLMNRAHAYKAAVADNAARGARDPDQGINLGLYCYPVLMGADILMFNAHQVPVGRDQMQHLEMTRDIAQRFNHTYGEHFVLPEAVIAEDVAVLCGIDGRKMSKSYDNTVPLFAEPDFMRRRIQKIKTDSLAAGAPKNTEGCTLFQLYAALASADQRHAMAEAYADGIAWKDVKQALFELLEARLAEPRARYRQLMAAPDEVDALLARGAERARAHSAPFLERLHAAVGLR